MTMSPDSSHPNILCWLYWWCFRYFCWLFDSFLYFFILFNHHCFIHLLCWCANEWNINFTFVCAGYRFKNLPFYICGLWQFLLIFTEWHSPKAWMHIIYFKTNVSLFLVFFFSISFIFFNSPSFHYYYFHSLSLFFLRHLFKYTICEVSYFSLC